MSLRPATTLLDRVHRRLLLAAPVATERHCVTNPSVIIMLNFCCPPGLLVIGTKGALLLSTPLLLGGSTSSRKREPSSQPPSSAAAPAPSPGPAGTAGTAVAHITGLTATPASQAVTDSGGDGSLHDAGKAGVGMIRLSQLLSDPHQGPGRSASLALDAADAVGMPLCGNGWSYVPWSCASVSHGSDREAVGVRGLGADDLGTADMDVQLHVNTGHASGAGARRGASGRARWGSEPGGSGSHAAAVARGAGGAGGSLGRGGGGSTSSSSDGGLGGSMSEDSDGGRLRRGRRGGGGVGAAGSRLQELLVPLLSDCGAHGDTRPRSSARPLQQVRAALHARCASVASQPISFPHQRAHKRDPWCEHFRIASQGRPR